MRVLLQRVSTAKVTIEEKVKATIGFGMLIFVGIEEADTNEDVDHLCGKITRLRIFPDGSGIMNLSIQDVGGELLVISQFTLHASTKKGNRPSYYKAAGPEMAMPLYEYFLDKLWSTANLPVKSGVFGGDMKVELINDGPVTIWMDSKNRD